MTKREVRAAGELLRGIIARIASGELTAPARVVARLEGAASALEAVAERRRVERGGGA